VTYLSASDGTPPRVAYAIGKPVGDAVTRNRLRRQLRSIVAERSRKGELACGAYLVGAQPAAGLLSFAELDDLVGQALSALRGA
jgi:ribonuclease P protein component